MDSQREAERQRGREAERQRDRETARQRNTETSRQQNRPLPCATVCPLQAPPPVASRSRSAR
eukprot:2813770-Lingulodinium_polyedra.AAC.1